MPASLPVLRRGGLAAVLALVVLSACGGIGGGSDEAPTPSPSATAAAPVDVAKVFADLRAAAATAPAAAATLAGGLAETGKLQGDPGSAAAELRAALEVGLVEHVHLTGLAALAAYRFGQDSPTAAAGVGALQANAASLVDLVGGAASGQRDEFAAAWGDRIDAELAYAAAADDGADGQGARTAASARLLANAKDLGKVFAGASDGVLSASAVQREFVAASTRITAALDALGDASSDAPKLLRSADGQAADLAATLAAGLDRAAGLAGDPNETGPALRADLAGLLAEHAYLTGLSAFYGATSDGGTPEPVAAADAAYANAQSTATVVGATIGRERQGEFIALWRAYGEDLREYTAGDEAARTAASARLSEFPAKAGTFLADASGGTLLAADVGGALAPVVETSIRALDSLRSLRGVPTAVPAPPSAPTPAPTATETPVETATPTATATATETALPTDTPTATETPAG